MESRSGRTKDLEHVLNASLRNAQHKEKDIEGKLFFGTGIGVAPTPTIMAVSQSSGRLRSR